jgi:putative ABC transport system substrate-binding protein
MRRRDFIGLLGGAAAGPALLWPLGARAQGNVLRVGIIDNSPLWEPFRRALREHGYVEGRTIAFEYREAADDPARLVAAAAELARLPVDVIATYGTPATRAAMRATDRIPIVMIGIGDPVGAGLVASLGRPGGNVTGNTVLSPDVGGKRLQLLKEGLGAARVGLLWNPGNASHAAILDELKAAAPGLGIALIPVPVRRFDEFEAAFSAMMRERPNAFMMTADPLHLRHADWIIAFLAKNRLPGMFQVRENVVAGGLMSYGASLPDLFRRAGGYVQKILNGTKPAELPIEQATTFELVINLKTAKALGLTIPEPFLLRTDEVIE